MIASTVLVVSNHGEIVGGGEVSLLALLERLDRSRSYVFVVNHTSIVDIWALLVAVPNSFRFVAKQELSHVPVFGKAMQSAGNIFIDRGNLTSSFASYDVAAAQLRQGLSAMVFAEGTRSRDGRLLPFKKGPFILAIRAGVAIPHHFDLFEFNTATPDEFVAECRRLGQRSHELQNGEGLDL